MTPEHCRRTADRKDCVNGEISGMVVTRRVPSPRSVRHLLQVASVSASVVGKRVLHVKHGRSASSRASLRGESLLRGEVQLCCERTKLGGCDLSLTAARLGYEAPLDKIRKIQMFKLCDFEILHGVRLDKIKTFQNT